MRISLAHPKRPRVHEALHTFPKVHFQQQPVTFLRVRARAHLHVTRRGLDGACWLAGGGGCVERA